VTGRVIAGLDLQLSDIDLRPSRDCGGTPSLVGGGGKGLSIVNFPSTGALGAPTFPYGRGQTEVAAHSC
jgi:hypothetical protein